MSEEQSSSNVGVVHDPPDSPDIPLADLEGVENAQSEPIDVPKDALDENADDKQVEEEGGAAEAETRPKKGKARFDGSRRPGKTNLPMARVQRVIKADKDLPTVQREAAFLIGAAAEDFTMRMAAAVERIVHKDKRMTAQYKDVVALSRRDEYIFMDEIVASVLSTQPKRKVKDVLKDGGEESKRKKKKTEPVGAGPMDKFFASKKSLDEKGDFAIDSDAQVIMNEDGTMSMTIE